MTIRADGKVGIGTTSPALLLEVSQSVNSDFAGAVRNFSSTGWGFQVQGGGDSGDYAFHCKNYADTQVLFTVRGTGEITAPAAFDFLKLSSNAYDTCLERTHRYIAS